MSFADCKKIWMNGEIINWDDAKIHVMSHVIHYGTGIFEGMRCYETERGSSVFRMRDHYRRFLDTAKIYSMEIPYSIEQLEKATVDIIKANTFANCYIRPIAYFGFNSLGVFPRQCPIDVVIGVWPWGAYLGEEALENGIKVMVTSWQRFHSAMMPSAGKACGQYVSSYLSVCDARSKGYDEAIMLDKEGDVAEGSGENVFIVRDGIVYTNDATSSILVGITRDTAIQLARDIGCEVVIKKISKGELYIADEVFFTGTAAEITPVVEIDGRTIGNGTKGPVTDAVQQRFFEVIKGKTSEYDRWHTFLD